MAQTTYVKLDQRQIRILVILPGEQVDPLRGALETLTLPEDVPLSKHMAKRMTNSQASSTMTMKRCDYEAISYVWGEPIFSHELRFLEQNEVMRITRSLFEALTAFRHIDRPRRLWADGICINQPDVEERNAQVSMMADIYACAQSVLVWLGPSTESTALALNTIWAWNERDYEVSQEPGFEDRAQTWYGDLHDALRQRPGRSTLNDLGLDSATVEATSRSLEGIRALTQRPWFSRLWTVQESSPALVDNVRFYCGEHSVSRIENAIRALMEIAPSLSKDYALLADVYYHLATGALFELREFRPDSAVMVLLQYSTRSCTDARDRIFAFRKLLGATELCLLRPDYNLSAAEVYRRFTIACISESSHREAWTLRCNRSLLLALCGTEDTNRSLVTPLGGLSWVPRLNELSSLSRGKRNLYASSGQMLTPRTMLSHNQMRTVLPSWRALPHGLKAYTAPGLDHELRLRGRCFAVVSEPSYGALDDTLLSMLSKGAQQDASSGVEADMHVLHFIRHFSKVCHVIETHVSSSEGIAVFFNYLVETLEQANHNNDVPFSIIQFLCKHYKEDTVAIYDNLDDDSEQQVRLLMDHLYKTDDLRKIRLWIITCQSDGRLDVAWLPEDTRPGDQLCYFTGGLFPFVIRPLEDDRYVLIGDGHTFSVPLIEALGGEHKDREPGVELLQGEKLGLNMLGQPIEQLVENAAYITLI